MSVRPYRDIQRRACRKIHVGKVPVGGDVPITVQSMTRTVGRATPGGPSEQIQALERACDDRFARAAWTRKSALA